MYKRFSIRFMTDFSLWKTVRMFFKKLKIELSYDPGFALPCSYLRGKENSDLKRHMNLNVYSSTIYTSQNMERAQMFIS